MKHRWLLIGFTSLALTGLGFNTAMAAEEKEEKVSMRDVPKEVRATLKREANGEKIKSVDKEEQKGKVVYEADVKMDGHNYEIVVDEDGLLVSKKLDDEEDEKADKPKGKHEEKAARESEDDHKDKKAGKHEEKSAHESEDDHKDKKASKHEDGDEEKSEHKKSEKMKKNKDKDKDDEDEKK